jgi:hypothetical protein
MCGLQGFCFPPNSLISKNWQEKLVKITLDNKNSQLVKKQRNLSKTNKSLYSFGTKEHPINQI